MEQKIQKNIWYFHHYATPTTMSGMSRPSNFAHHLIRKGHKVTVFGASFMHYSGENVINDRSLFVTNHDTEVPFVFVRTNGYQNSGKARVWNMLMFFRNLKRTVRKYLRTASKPDVIIASSPHPLTMWAGIQIARRLKIPCICEVRDFWPEVFFFGGRLKKESIPGRLLLAGEHWIYRNASAMIFLKEGDSNYLLEHRWDQDTHGGDIPLAKCHYINNGINFNEFQQDIRNHVLEDLDLNSDKFKIVYTGAIRPVNNVGAILDCAKLIKDPDCIFLIYGGGNQVEELQRRVQEEKIHNVIIKGYVAKKYIPYILSRSSINLLNYSSDQYNWSRGNSSNKLFEYMASGKPIISTVTMAYCLLEKYQCGLSLEQSSPENLAKAILEIKNYSEEKYKTMSQNAILGAKEFDFGILSEKLLGVIESVCAQSSN